MASEMPIHEMPLMVVHGHLRDPMIEVEVLGTDDPKEAALRAMKARPDVRFEYVETIGAAGETLGSIDILGRCEASGRVILYGDDYLTDVDGLRFLREYVNVTPADLAACDDAE